MKLLEGPVEAIIGKKIQINATTPVDFPDNAWLPQYRSQLVLKALQMPLADIEQLKKTDLSLRSIEMAVHKNAVQKAVQEAVQEDLDEDSDEDDADNKLNFMNSESLARVHPNNLEELSGDRMAAVANRLERIVAISPGQSETENLKTLASDLLLEGALDRHQLHAEHRGRLHAELKYKHMKKLLLDEMNYRAKLEEAKRKESKCA